VPYRAIETDQGELRIHPSRAMRPTATLLLHHGAGGGIESPDLVALARRLPRLGINVFRVEQPWRVAGSRVAAAPNRLDEAALVAANAIRVRTPIIWGGRSAGARVACRMARQMGAVGALALAFPLHPPGRPERSRLDELLGAGVPTLVVQGERDPFGTPAEFPADSRGMDHPPGRLTGRRWPQHAAGNAGAAGLVEVDNASKTETSPGASSEPEEADVPCSPPFGPPAPTFGAAGIRGTHRRGGGRGHYPCRR
jgi:predicted alpha/beta-hydrolase family hydrolase